MSSGENVSVNLSSVQNIRKAVLLAAILCGIAFMLVGDSRWPSGSFVHETVEWIGLIPIVACIIGRTFCTLYIGGRKIDRLTTEGPYSVTRNPLYAWSVVGAAGAGAQLGSVALALAAGLVVYFVFLLVVFKEERVLADRFGESYRAYLDRVPRFWPDFSLWRDVDKVEVSPRLVRTTALDACVFLLSIPLAEGVEFLHDMSWLPTLFTLP
jgi:protein-S-isoprenylcysteine O-methyltransferase Ste14